MPIIHLTGPANSGKSLLANSMRNTHIGTSKPEEGVYKGFLLVDEDQDGEPRYLLEKLMLGGSLGERAGQGDPVPQAADTIAWKDDITAIFVNDKIAVLDDIEELAPGFIKKFGPVRKMALA